MDEIEQLHAFAKGTIGEVAVIVDTLRTGKHLNNRVFYYNELKDRCNIRPFVLTVNNEIAHDTAAFNGHAVLKLLIGFSILKQAVYAHGTAYVVAKIEVYSPITYQLIFIN
jgi:hypothetical protein